MRNVTEVIKELTEIFGTDVTLELKMDGQWVLRNGVTTVQQTETTPLHKELSPFFYGDEEVTDEFIKRTNGCNDMGVCEILNDYIKRGKVQRRGMKSKVYEILHRYGLYRAGYTNFTMYVH